MTGLAGALSFVTILTIVDSVDFGAKSMTFDPAESLLRVSPPQVVEAQAHSSQLIHCTVDP